jgi:hypothetical protein
VTTRDESRQADTTAMSTGQLIASIKDDLSGLVRSEVELAKAELRESAARAGAGSALGVAAAYCLVLASVVLVIAAAYGLTGLGLHPGWAFLIVGGALVLLAALLLLVARGRFTGIRGPERAQRAAARVRAALRPGSKT